MLRPALLSAILCYASLWAVEPVKVVLSKQGNVRYGPSENSKVRIITTLPPGSSVEVLGPVEGVPGWFEVRFPRDGKAWVNGRNLRTASPDKPRMLVATGEANIRSDARNSADLVGQLQSGQTVEWVGVEKNGQFFGTKVDTWYAIYPPDATAFISEKVLKLTPELIAQIQARSGKTVVARPASTPVDNSSPAPTTPVGNPAASPAAQEAATRLWPLASSHYARFKQVYDSDKVQARELDWRGLAKLFAQVANDHPNPKTRNDATTYCASVSAVRAWVDDERQKLGLGPVPPMDFEAPLVALADTGSRPEAVKPTLKPEPKPDTVKPEPKPEVAKPKPDAVKPEPKPDAVKPEPKPDAVKPEPKLAVQPDIKPESKPEVVKPPVVPPAAKVAEQELVGWLQQADVSGVAAEFMLMDANSEVVALVTADPSANVALAEFFWRRVAIRGATTTVEATVTGRKRSLPLVTVRTPPRLVAMQ